MSSPVFWFALTSTSPTATRLTTLPASSSRSVFARPGLSCVACEDVSDAESPQIKSHVQTSCTVAATSHATSGPSHQGPMIAARAPAAAPAVKAQGHGAPV